MSGRSARRRRRPTPRSGRATPARYQQGPAAGARGGECERDDGQDDDTYGADNGQWRERKAGRQRRGSGRLRTTARRGGGRLGSVEDAPGCGGRIHVGLRGGMVGTGGRPNRVGLTSRRAGGTSDPAGRLPRTISSRPYLWLINRRCMPVPRQRVHMGEPWPRPAVQARRRAVTAGAPPARATPAPAAWSRARRP